MGNLLQLSTENDRRTTVERIAQRTAWLGFQTLVRFEFAILDILTIPGSLTAAVLKVVARVSGREGIATTGRMINAVWHVEFVCRMCPRSRRDTRDPQRQGFCLWNHHWRQGNYAIPPDFGFANYLRQYGDGETDLSNYEHLDPRS